MALPPLTLPDGRRFEVRQSGDGMPALHEIDAEMAIPARSVAEEWRGVLGGGRPSKFVTDDEGNVIRDVTGTREDPPETAMVLDPSSDLDDFEVLEASGRAEDALTTEEEKLEKGRKRERKKMGRRRLIQPNETQETLDEPVPTAPSNDLSQLISFAVARGIAQTYGNILAQFEQITAEFTGAVGDLRDVTISLRAALVELQGEATDRADEASTQNEFDGTQQDSE